MPEISMEMVKLLNEQLRKELESAYLYLSMAAYFESKGLKGFAHWMKLQAKEELEHAMKIYNYIYERGGRVELQTIPKPPGEWDSVTSAIRAALSHEEHMTTSINELYKKAVEMNDYATQVFLHWFIEEQVEEEDQLRDILSKLELAGESPNIIFILDRMMSERK